MAPATAARRQSGQAFVIVAGGMIAILAMTGLILMSGTAYWDRRNLQTLADSAALAASLKVGLACSPTEATAAINEADRVIALALGPATSSTVSGTCSSRYTGTYTYPGNYAATYGFPYQGDNTKVEVNVSQVAAFQLAPFIGQGSGTIRARAVAKRLAGTPATTFAIFGRDSVSCQGASQIVAQGSIYSRNAPGGAGNCKIRATALKDSANNYLDFGNFVSYADGFNWGSCGPGSGNNFCADGYQLAGHSAGSVVCGTTTVSQYLDLAQLPLNPDPCTASPPPPAPDLAYPRYPDPNVSAPNPTTGLCQPSSVYPAASVSYADGSGWGHYVQGCYSTLDATGQQAVLDPGFYFFNGSGVCLGGSGRLLGQDVTLEFAGGANFTSLQCGLSGACGSSCGFGADPAQPSPDPSATVPMTWFSAPTSTSSWCTSACPSQGILIYSAPTSGGSFLVKGPAEASWLKGSIFWPNGDCTWWANGTSTIYGQLVCANVRLQGGAVSTGAGVTFGPDVINRQAEEAALVE